MALPGAELMARRILMASDFYRPFIGGAERQVEILSKQLHSRGYEMAVATMWHAGLAREEDDEGVALHRLSALSTRTGRFSGDPRRRYHPPFPDPVMALELRRLIHKFKPDLVHAHGWIAYSCAAALLGSDVPLLISVRDYGYTCATRTMLYKGKTCDGPSPLKCLGCASEKYGRPKAAAAVAGVFSGRPLLTRKIVGAHSITSFVQTVTRRDLLHESRESAGSLVPDFVIPSFLELTGGQASLGDQLPAEPYILFVGALQAHKGVNVLLQAYERLPVKPPLVLIGTRWPDTPAFPPGVTVLENVPHAGVMSAWDRCLFGVVPSVWPEPLGVVSLEAMSRAKAVVGSAVGGITDIVVDGETGFLTDPGDVPQLAARMAELIADPALRERFGQAGRVRIQLFTSESVLPRFERLYDSLLETPSAPGRAQRILVAGGSGSGKTTIAGQLAARRNLPVHHLDEIALAPADGHLRPLEERIAEVHDIAAGEHWVVEGIYTGWTAELYDRAEVIVWLDSVSWSTAVRRVIGRFASGALVEMRQRGLRGLIRPREQLHHLADLGRSIRETRAYYAGRDAGALAALDSIEPAVLEPGDEPLTGHDATAAILSPLRAKVVHCRSARDVRRMLEQLG
ncbi:MAG TPA: glycosyltransferase [Candidatus Limnocylindrales bacterium]